MGPALHRLTLCMVFPQKKFTQRSDRVKGVDLHPSEPWCACAVGLHHGRGLQSGMHINTRAAPLQAPGKSLQRQCLHLEHSGPGEQAYTPLSVMPMAGYECAH